MDDDVLARVVYQYSTITADEQAERVARVIRSGALGAIGGTEVAEFERRAAHMLGRRGALAVSSATAGLDAILRALRIGQGDDVVIPELSWISVGAAVWATGACPVVAPVGEDLALTWDELEPLLGPRTRAVVLAHMRGMAATCVHRIAAGLGARGVVLIDDCAQAWGVRSAGRRGLASVYSTQTYKLIATGEGGIVLTDDEELLESMRALSGDTRVATPEPSWRLNHWMGEVQAAMALPQLDSLAGLVDRLQPLQREIASIFAASSAVRAVMPHVDGTDEDTNGSLVGLWFHDRDRRQPRRPTSAGPGCAATSRPRTATSTSPDRGQFEPGARWWTSSCTRTWQCHSSSRVTWTPSSAASELSSAAWPP